MSRVDLHLERKNSDLVVSQGCTYNWGKRIKGLVACQWWTCNLDKKWVGPSCESLVDLQSRQKKDQEPNCEYGCLAIGIKNGAYSVAR